MSDWLSPFWCLRLFGAHVIWAALLASLFTVGSTDQLFATVIAESEASCEPAEVVRVRVDDLHFNLPKEEQLKLASTRKQLVFLALFSLVPEKRRITQKLDGKSAIGPAHTYCQEGAELGPNVFGFGLVPDREYMQGPQDALSESLAMLWVSKIKSAAEERRRDILLIEKGEAHTSSKIQNSAEVYKFNVKIRNGRRPVFQYFVKPQAPERRTFLVECFPIPGGKKPREQCSFFALVGHSVGLSGQFFTDVLPQELWVERLQQVDDWYQGLPQSH